MTHTDVSLSPTKLSEPVLAFATRFARQQAQNLVGHFGFRSDDCDDLTQELLLAVVERWPTFDRSRSQPEAFATVVMRRQVASLIRQRFVQKRQFDQLLGSPDTSDNADTATRFRTGEPRRSDQELVDFATDMETLIGQLSPASQELCRRLMSESVTEIAAATAVPRSTLADRVKRLRPHFDQAEMREYL